MKKIPLCAFCGGSLRRGARMILDWSLPRAPRVAWHADAPEDRPCMVADPILQEMRNAGERRLWDFLDQIAARGPGRLIVSRTRKN